MDCSRAWGKGPGGVSGGVAERRVPDLPALPVAMMVVVGGGVGGGGCLERISQRQQPRDVREMSQKARHPIGSFVFARKAPKRDLSDVASSLVKGKKGLESKGEPQNTRVQQTQERFTHRISSMFKTKDDPLKDGPFRRRETEVCILTWKIGNER
ncbi:hypothetical protein HZH68_016897 [Vespula germanica]|uniref:Uncharacterized protein n=1 Tax=Vespula germanica TaxID=30212 RepID=A0A834J3U8_VESGE|nr:hypothetical protein HZH68_016897 [Vespula germanica]